MLAISACERKPDRLQYALEFAGKNRIELEKVLEHYKSDSLKYRAACFLIKNMVCLRWLAIRYVTYTDEQTTERDINRRRKKALAGI